MVLKANTLKDPFRSSWNSRTILLQTRARNFKTTKRQFVKKSASVSLVISVLNIDLVSDLITKLDFTSSEAHLATVSFISGVFTGLISQFSYGRSEKLRSSRGKLPSFSLNSSNRESLDSQAFVGSVLTPIDGNSVEQANWFNKIVAAAWPYLDEATSNAITRALDPILKATRPTFLTSLRFERFSFGSVPAIIQGVKVYDTQDRGAVEIDLEIFWAGDPDVVLGIRAANDTLNVPVSLTELQCAFKLRLIFAPLIGVFPCFGALTIALVEEPSLDFDLRVVGGDITLVPGLKIPTKKERENFNKNISHDPEFLEKILMDFGVSGNIKKVSHGPVVTLNEFEPAAGVKVSKIINLSDDIARNTSSESARIATIPGSNTVGIELPNNSRENVYLSEILNNSDFKKKDIKLPIALGKNISGVPIVGDLASMPHLLIAGTTGSGKSVCINTIILSLLYRHTPDKCKFILIDPKMLELSTYEGIPHLLCPVITEAKKAASVLGWVVKEMESRYRLMTKEGVRNIDGYNAKHKLPMPYIVVVVDEMSDLMLVAGKEIENYIQKLSQMARAAGIHIIMATQRPSVDVITGTIKANFPTRISFQVTSKIDSRTILGEQGAEQLLGKGDMLYMSSANRIVRIHAPFVSDNEIEKINSSLRSQAEPDYIDEILNFADEKEIGDIQNQEDKDELYQSALEIIKSEGKASTSFLQRKLQIGYNRAARIIDMMEADGVVSKANHVGKREVL